MTMGTVPKSSARDRTRSDLYQLISAQVETTRSDLVEATGLSRSTVNQAVARLIADGVVEVRPRVGGTAEQVPLAEAPDRVAELVDDLLAD